MPIKWNLFVEKKEAEEFEKFINIIAKEHWRVVQKVSSTAASFETESGDAKIESKLEHIFAHQEYALRFASLIGAAASTDRSGAAFLSCKSWNKEQWEQILLTREDTSSSQKPITLNILENERFVSQFSPEQVLAEGILKVNTVQ
jgi:hypothetical protein